MYTYTMNENEGSTMAIKEIPLIGIVGDVFIAVCSNPDCVNGGWESELLITEENLWCFDCETSQPFYAE